MKPETKAVKPNKTKKKPIIIVCIVAVCLVLICVFAFNTSYVQVMLHRGDKITGSIDFSLNNNDFTPTPVLLWKGEDNDLLDAPDGKFSIRGGKTESYTIAAYVENHNLDYELGTNDLLKDFYNNSTPVKVSLNVTDAKQISNIDIICDIFKDGDKIKANVIVKYRHMNGTELFPINETVEKNYVWTEIAKDGIEIKL